MDRDEKLRKVIEAEKNIAILGQTPNEELGITQKYNKTNRNKLWDSQKDKTAYKEKVFGDKKTYKDPISGKILHKNQKSAQNKYHMKNADGKKVSKVWIQHFGETDHINTLSGVHKVAKKNPFLTDSDLKKIVNKEDNYRLLSKEYNIAKGGMDDWEFIKKKFPEIAKKNNLKLTDEEIRNVQKNMAQEKIHADLVLHKEFTLKTAQHVGEEIITGAKETLVGSIIPLTAIAVDQMCKVVKGEVASEDAVKEAGKAVVDVAVVGGTQKLILDVTNSIFKNSTAATQIVNVAWVVKDSAIKYLNGEINGKQFLEEVDEKGTVMVAGMIGGAVGKEIGGVIGLSIGTILLPGVGTTVGAVVGQILGSIITTVACGIIVSFYSTAKNLDKYKLKEKEMKILEEEAIKEIERQRDIFKDLVEREFKYWDEEIEDGFKKIFESAIKEENASEGVTEGLDRILNVFGKKVRFKTLEEYESQLNTTLVLEI